MSAHPTLVPMDSAVTVRSEQIPRPKRPSDDKLEGFRPKANSGEPKATKQQPLPYFPSTAVRYTVKVPQNSRALICTGRCWASSVYQIQMRPRFFSGP